RRLAFDEAYYSRLLFSDFILRIGIHYYNHDERIKVKLQGLSPVQYRNQFIKTA
ncbi:IS3 family transposase, partial [Acinetobacter baumannii]